MMTTASRLRIALNEARAEIERLKKENDQLRDIKLVQDGAELKLLVGGFPRPICRSVHLPSDVQIISMEYKS